MDAQGFSQYLACIHSLHWLLCWLQRATIHTYVKCTKPLHCALIQYLFIVTLRFKRTKSYTI